MAGRPVRVLAPGARGAPPAAAHPRPRRRVGASPRLVPDAHRGVRDLPDRRHRSPGSTVATHRSRRPPGWSRVRYYRWVTYAYIPLQYLSLVLACSMWASGDLAWWQSLGLATSVGLVGGIAINTAHELGHKRPALERWLSKVALAQTAYGHFQLEHNRGHHAKVSTPEDPASARLGESFYEFLPRTVVGQPAVRPAARARARGAPRPAVLGPPQRAAQRLGDDRRCSSAGWSAWFGLARRSRGSCSRRCSGSRCSRSSTTSSTTGCSASSGPTGATSAAAPSTPGTPATWCPTCCCSSSSATATTTPTRPAATRCCATTTTCPSCPPATPG